jgi:SulP family sulfate permease
MPQLLQLMFLSSAVHQMAFSLFSSLPFAVGQVQDAGLIFLSAMASSVVHHAKLGGKNAEGVLATTLVILALSTALLGVALMVTGRLKLAQLVAYLPMPVIGGYLAFIGFFCLLAGITMMTGLQIRGEHVLALVPSFRVARPIMFCCLRAQ